MGIVLKFFKWLLIVIVAIIGLIIGLPHLPVAQDQFGKGRYTEYLQQNASALSLDEAEAGISLRQEDYQNQFFMMGEMHGFAVPQTLDLALLQHLNDRIGTRIYLAEMGPAQALAVNDYLAGGDDTELRGIFDRWAQENAQWGNQEFFAKFAKIKALNNSLPDGQKIHFIGVDKLHDRAFAEQMAGVMRIALAPGFADHGSVQSINVRLLNAALMREAKTSRYRHILDNIEMMMEVSGAKNETFYALWGLFHGSKVDINGSKPLAKHLNAEDGAFAGKVATFLTYCVNDCENMLPAGGMPFDMPGWSGQPYLKLPMSFDTAMMWRVHGIGEAKAEMGDAAAILIPLRAEDTPYMKGDRLLKASGFITLMSGFEYDGSAAEAADYAFVMNGSAALTPWQGEIYDVRSGGR